MMQLLTESPTGRRRSSECDWWDFKKKKNVSQKNGSKWIKLTSNERIRERAENKTIDMPNVKQYAKKDKCHCWWLFFDCQMIEDMVCWTNVTIQQKCFAYQSKSPVKATNVSEIRAFIGLPYSAGMFHSKRHNLGDL